MEEIVAVELQQRMAKWVEEGQSLFSLLQGIFGENERLRALVRTKEQECEKLRQEQGEILKERDELMGDLSKVLTEILHPMNEMVQKVRGKTGKSPFRRETAA